MSAATARTHVSRAMIKVGARDRAQLVVFAYETGLARPGWRVTRATSRDVAPRSRPCADDGRHAGSADSGAMDTTAAVSVHGLTKRYGDRTVVDGLDLELPHGRRRRLRRAQRRRQDDHHGHAPRARAADRRHGHRARRAHRRPGRLPAAGRGAGREPGVLPGAQRSGEPADVRHRRPAPDGPHRRPARRRRPRPTAATTATAPTRSG